MKLRLILVIFIFFCKANAEETEDGLLEKYFNLPKEKKLISFNYALKNKKTNSEKYQWSYLIKKNEAEKVNFKLIVLEPKPLDFYIVERINVMAFTDVDAYYCEFNCDNKKYPEGTFFTITLYKNPSSREELVKIICEYKTNGQIDNLKNEFDKCNQEILKIKINQKESIVQNSNEVEYKEKMKMLLEKNLKIAEKLYELQDLLLKQVNIDLFEARSEWEIIELKKANKTYYGELKDLDLQLFNAEIERKRANKELYETRSELKSLELKLANECLVEIRSSLKDLAPKK